MTAPGPRSPAADGPPAELVARFKGALARLWPEGGRLGLAVSGGPDSLAMLLLAEAAIPGQFEVATVDHGLRPESDSECAMVTRVCSDREIPCDVLKISVPKGNLQAEARTERYIALTGWAEARGLSAVVTAHHADDQAETLLMRLNRGSGVSGLAGVRERGRMLMSPIPLIRPLLGFRSAELVEVVQTSGLDPVQDPSNTDDKYDRARIRKALADSDWLDASAMTVAASNLAEDAEGLEWAAQREWAERVTETAGEFRYRRPPLENWLTQLTSDENPVELIGGRAPRAVALRVLGLVLMRFGAQPRGQDVARLLDRLEEGKGGNLAGALATVEGDEWVFRREPPRRSS